MSSHHGRSRTTPERDTPRRTALGKNTNSPQYETARVDNCIGPNAAERTIAISTQTTNIPAVALRIPAPRMFNQTRTAETASEQPIASNSDMLMPGRIARDCGRCNPRSVRTWRRKIRAWDPRRQVERMSIVSPVCSNIRTARYRYPARKREQAGEWRAGCENRSGVAWSWPGDNRRADYAELQLCT